MQIGLVGLRFAGSFIDFESGARNFDCGVANPSALLPKVLEKGPASTAQLHRAIVTELDIVLAFSQSQILRLLQEMERSGSVHGSVASSQAYLVWELAERGSKAVRANGAPSLYFLDWVAGAASVQTTTASKRRRCASAIQAIKLQARLLRATDTDVNVADGPATTLGVLAKFPRLHGGVLAVVCRAHPCVDCDLHRLCIPLTSRSLAFYFGDTCYSEFSRKRGLFSVLDLV
jgi:hypothetical protein